PCERSCSAYCSVTSGGTGAQATFRQQLVVHKLYADPEELDKLDVGVFLDLHRFEADRSTARDLGEVRQNFRHLAGGRCPAVRSRGSEAIQKSLAPGRQRVDALIQRGIVVGQQRVEFHVGRSEHRGALLKQIRQRTVAIRQRDRVGKDL